VSAPADHRLALLRGLYGDAAESIEARAATRLAHEPRLRTPDPTQADAWLIAYADSFQQRGVPPLVTLREVVDRYLAPEIDGVHVLPFHPASSDRGFSVVDYGAVEPAFGTWDDVAALAAGRRFMADAVLNHMSAESNWFRSFLAGEPPYDGFFRTVDPDADLSMVVRPRTLPVVTSFDGVDGPVYVWTTFSADQVDLDYRNPDVLLAALDILLRYRAAGATAIRLDAIAFLWKVEGSPSINLRKTHDLIEVLRSWLDEVDPGVMIVTETNVPHAENVSYLGRPGRREAQAVYQFALPPLILHTLATGNPEPLVGWAAGLGEPPTGCTYLNFTSSHDGVGLRPVESLLPAAATHRMTELCESVGGVVNRRRVQDGTDVPYELASTWYSLMTAIDPEPERALARHVLSQAFVLALRGIPLLYTHVLLASSNDIEGYRRTGIARDLNRADVDVDALDAAMADPRSRASRATTAIRRMLRWRASCDAFHPDAPQRVTCKGSVVIVERTGRSGETARVLLNISTEDTTAELDDESVTVPALESVWIAHTSDVVRVIDTR
jgi:glucosylglycerate phosphorylase